MAQAPLIQDLPSFLKGLCIAGHQAVAERMLAHLWRKDVSPYRFGPYEMVWPFQFLQSAKDGTQNPLALFSVIELFRRETNLLWFKRCEELAEAAAWPDLKDTLLDMARANERADTLEVYLALEQYDDAIRIAQRYDVQEPVRFALAERVIRTHPAYVIGQAQQCVDAILLSGVASRYERAVAWLQLRQAAHDSEGTIEDWLAYLEDLLQVHSQKRKFLGMLKGKV